METQGFRTTGDPALAVPAWAVPAGLAVQFPAGCVAVGSLFPDLPFQDPAVRCVCGSVPAHRLRQGKRGWGRAGVLASCPISWLSLSSSLRFVPDSEIQVEGADGEAPSGLSLGRQSKNTGINQPHFSQLCLCFSPVPWATQWRPSLPDIRLVALLVNKTERLFFPSWVCFFANRNTAV